MSILRSRISDRITRGVQFTLHIPGRTLNRTPSGLLFQNFMGTRIAHMCDLSHGLRSRDDFQSVVDAFIVVVTNGYEGLLVKDWRDYLASQSNSNGSVIDATHIQLQRKHIFGAATHYRDITAPCASPAAQVYRNHLGTVSAIGSTVDTATGIAIISGHTTGDTYTWAGQFDTPMAFADDDWMGSLEVSTDNLHVQSSPIKMEEILP